MRLCGGDRIAGRPDERRPLAVRRHREQLIAFDRRVDAGRRRLETVNRYLTAEKEELVRPAKSSGP